MGGASRVHQAKADSDVATWKEGSAQEPWCPQACRKTARTLKPHNSVSPDVSPNPQACPKLAHNFLRKTVSEPKVIAASNSYSCIQVGESGTEGSYQNAASVAPHPNTLGWGAPHRNHGIHQAHMENSPRPNAIQPCLPLFISGIPQASLGFLVSFLRKTAMRAQ